MRIYLKFLLGLLIVSIAFGAGYLYTNVDRPLVKKSEIDEAYQLGCKSLIVLSNGLYKLDKAMPWEKAHEQSEILAQLSYLNTIADQSVLNLNKLAYRKPVERIIDICERVKIYSEKLAIDYRKGVAAGDFSRADLAVEKLAGFYLNSQEGVVLPKEFLGFFDREAVETYKVLKDKMPIKRITFRSSSMNAATRTFK